MVIRTYFDKSNTIVKNQDVNTGLNPVTELFYGGQVGQQVYSRFLFYFDATRLQALYSGGTFTDLNKLTHTLRMTNTGSLDKSLLNTPYAGKDKATSFDLIAFTVNQPWDSGTGYDYAQAINMVGDNAYTLGVSNWTQAQTGVFWSGGTGVYSGSPSGITVTTQHFDLGNENIEMDITSYVNSLILGAPNNGLGLAFPTNLETLNTFNLQYVGFFTNNTQTFYEPFVETVYNNVIMDDRNNFFLDKANKLYLYVNIAGNPANLDTNPAVNVYDYEGNLFSAFTSAQVTHETLGVYSINLIVPTTADNLETMYNDVWTGVTINSVTRPNITLDFVVKDSMGFYSIGNNDFLPKKVAVSIGGIQSGEKIKRGDIRKVIVSARIPYTVEQTQNISGLKYRLYVTEGSKEITVIDFQPVDMANNYYYFLIDTASLIPMVYYLDIQATSNLEVTTIKEAIKFEIVNQADLRKSQ